MEIHINGSTVDVTNITCSTDDEISKIEKELTERKNIYHYLKSNKTCDGFHHKFYTTLKSDISENIISYLIDDLRDCGDYNHDTINDIVNELENFLMDYQRPIENLKGMKAILENINLKIYDIYFPDHREEDLSYRIQFIIDHLKEIHFINCHFYGKEFNLHGKLYYENCTFYENSENNFFEIYNYNETFKYSDCTFKKNITLSSIDESHELNCNVFENCIFNGDIILKNICFNKTLFKLPNPLIELNQNRLTIDYNFNIEDIEKCYEFNNLSIQNCIFKSSLKLNFWNKSCTEKLKEEKIIPNLKFLEIDNLLIKETKFEKKLEIKNTDIGSLDFLDSNVEKVFDAFESKFKKAYFYKSIFHNFAGFEKVQFGQTSGSVTEFEYVTFLDFAVFREAKFHSGLDFSKTNLKSPPNFLNIDIKGNNTNRETFRIIKSSFDSVGNNIEGNLFFVEEMRAYEKELDADANKLKNKDWWIFKINDCISKFGSNYVRPIILLLLVISLYTLIFDKLTFDSFVLTNSIIDYTLFLMGFLYFGFKIYQKCLYQNKIFDVCIVGGSILFISTLKFIDYSSLNNGIYGNNFLNLMINNLAFMKLFKNTKNIIDLFFLIICSVLIWQTIVAIKRRVQR